MLKGLKSKKKADIKISESQTTVESEEIKTSISSMIKEEKSLKPSDYSSNLIQNLKKPLIESEISQRSCLKKSPVSFKSQNCEHCIESKCFPQNLLVSLQDIFHVSLPSKGSLVPGHCIISSNSHVLSSTDLESDEFEELLSIKKEILKFFREEHAKKTIFIESTGKLDECNHMVIECFPIDYEKFEEFYMTVIQEFNSADDEWTDNKKIIKVKNSNLQSSIPKGFPYVYVDFSMEQGIAHVIENQKRFTKDFVMNIICESLGLDLLFVRRKTQNLNLQLMHAEFMRKWGKNREI